MKVWVTLDNHIYMDGEHENVGVEAAGTLLPVMGTISLRYDEVDAENSVTHVEIVFAPDKVSIARVGEVSSRMMLDLTGRDTCTISMAGGILNMDTELLEYNAGTQEDGSFYWQLHYSLYAGVGAPAEHRMKITAKPM